MNDRTRLESEFDADMRSILEREKEVGFNSARFRQMIDRWGAVEAAHRLLRPDCELPSGTFSVLRDMGRLYLTMEHYVVMEKYQSLFSDEELAIAGFRLRAGD
jgi:hypothetical protein